jgi:hypothetical protein
MRTPVVLVAGPGDTAALALVTPASWTVEPFSQRDVVTDRWSALRPRDVMKPKAAERMDDAPAHRGRWQRAHAHTSQPTRAGEDGP